MRSTGTYATSTTSGESVQAFVPHALPPGQKKNRSYSYAAYIALLAE